MKACAFSLAVALAIGCGNVGFAQDENAGDRPAGPAEVPGVAQPRSVGDFLAAPAAAARAAGPASDVAAFESAIAAVPPGGEAVIAVPSIGRPYRLPGVFFDPGGRQITWAVDPGVTINNGAPGEWQRLNGPVSTARGILADGFANKNENTGFRILIGGGGVFANPDAKISGYDTVEEQATAHERGRAGLYMSVSDAGQLGVEDAGIASQKEIDLPSEAVPTSLLRVGMFVDAPGTTFPTIKGAPWRYTTRITGWTAKGKYATALQIEGWYRSTPNGKEAVRETPSVNRKAKTGRILINPLNKVWGSNLNLYLNTGDAPSFEKTSGAFAEWAVFNNTGEDFLTDFQQNTHPLHFYGVDLASNGTNGGGTAFQARGTRQWEYGFRVKSGATGFQVEGTQQTDGGTGFATTANRGMGPDIAFAALTFDGKRYDSNAEIKAKAPELHLGLGKAASKPALVLHSSGAKTDYDAKVSAAGGGKGDGGATLTVEAGTIVLDAGKGVVVLRNLPAGADGLPSGALYHDAKGFVKIVP